VKRAPQWIRRVGCFFLEHDEHAPDAEHTWSYCARCGATLSNVLGDADAPKDEEADA